MKKVLALVLALVLVLAMGVMPTATAETAPYEIKWMRYGTADQTGVSAVQDAANEWLANNGLADITIDISETFVGDTIQMRLAAKEKIDLIWSNASNLTTTLLAGNFYYDIGGIYKDYEGLYNSIPENIWNTLLRNGGKSLFQIPTYKEAGLANAFVIKKSDAEKFGWEEIIKNDPERIWSIDELEPYLAEAYATGEYVQPLYNGGTLVCNGSREYTLMDDFAAITDYIAVSMDEPTVVKKVMDIPAYREYVETMVKYNEAGYIYEGEATASNSQDLSWLFLMETLTPDFQNNMDNRYAKYDETGVYYLTLSDTYVTSTSALGSAMSIVSYCENVDAVMRMLDTLYSNSEYADLMLYGIEGVNYTRLEDGSCQKIADTGYTFATWATSNVMTVSLENTDAKDKKEQYAAFNASAKASPLLGFVFDKAPVDAEFNACNAVRAEYQALVEEGFMGVEGIDDYSAALDAAGVQALIAEAQAQLDAFNAAK